MKNTSPETLGLRAPAMCEGARSQCDGAGGRRTALRPCNGQLPGRPSPRPPASPPLPPLSLPISLPLSISLSLPPSLHPSLFVSLPPPPPPPMHQMLHSHCLPDPSLRPPTAHASFSPPPLPLPPFFPTQLLHMSRMAVPGVFGGGRANL